MQGWNFDDIGLVTFPDRNEMITIICWDIMPHLVNVSPARHCYTVAAIEVSVKKVAV